MLNQTFTKEINSLFVDSELDCRLESLQLDDLAKYIVVNPRTPQESFVDWVIFQVLSDYYHDVNEAERCQYLTPRLEVALNMAFLTRPEFTTMLNITNNLIKIKSEKFSNNTVDNN